VRGGIVRSQGFRASHQHLGRARHDKLSGVRGLGAAAQRPGDRRPEDPQLARALRPEGDGAAVGRGAALDDRGQEARLRGSGQVLCRSEIAKVPVAELISKSYAERRRKLIDPARANARPTHGEPKPADTIYMTVADKDGNAVSLIQSNYSSFGS